MWLIILDRSGSMAEPFSGFGPAEVNGRARLVDEPSKWAAATRVVRDEVASLAEGERVCVIAFNDLAATVFDGTPAEVFRLEAALVGIEPTGGTDLASALDAATALAVSSGGPQISVVVISDGLADEEKSRVAATALAARAGMIEVILIDPTPQGQAVAKAVSVRGRVTSIMSASELRVEAREASKHHAEETERVQHALARAEEVRQAVVTQVPSPERLGFTVGYPTRPLANTWSPLSVYLHLCREDLEEEVRRRLDEMENRAGLSITEGRTSLFASRGTWLKITPRIEGVDFNPPLQVVAWYEELQEVPFRFRVPEARASQSLTGTIEIACESGLWLGDLAISVRALGPTERLPQGELHSTSDTSRLPEEMFASYSHSDRDVVEACAAAYKALGVHLNIDRDDLTVGALWHPGLLALIDRSHLFQLYWSTTSKDSEFVRQEWEHALAQRGRKGARFVRGIYWREPMPEPPEPLSGIHFGYLDLGALSGPKVGAVPPAGEMPAQWSGNGNQVGTTKEVSAELIRRRAGAVQAAVLPLLPGQTRHRLAELREQVRLAVAFLEAATSLRYYPVPTLVVDDHVVHEVRGVLQMVDDVPSPDAAKAARGRREVEAYCDVLASLLLAFHTKQVPPLAATRSDSWDAMPEISGISIAALHGLREFGEWGIKRWTSAYLLDPWDQADGAHAPEGLVADQQPRRSLAGVALDAVAALADSASALAADPLQADRKVTTDFDRSTSSDPAGFDQRTAWNAIVNLQQWPGLTTSRKEVEWSGADKSWCPKHDWRYEVSGTVAAFALALELCRERLAELLPLLESWSYTAPGLNGDTALQAIGYAVAASRFGESLPSSIDWTLRKQAWSLGNNVVESLCPSWRRARDYLANWGMSEMADLEFPAFLAAYLSRMRSVFKFGLDRSPGFRYEGQLAISEAGKDVALALVPHLACKQADRHWGSETRFMLQGSFDGFVELFERASECFPRALSEVPGRDDGPRSSLLATQTLIETSTFGIFAPEGASDVDDRLAQWMVRQQGMPQVTLPRVPRVLYCLRALEAVASQRDDHTVPPATLRSLALLVHEHFHALAETAAGADGLPPSGPQRRDDWAAAIPLNEALAVWMEFHAMRELGPLLCTEQEAEAAIRAVWGYVCSGAYPGWPYRGAERVEAIYRSEGIGGVRRIVSELRLDPALARRRFEQLP